MGDFIYLLVMILLVLILGGFLLWRAIKANNAKYEADLARANVGAKAPVAALDQAGRALTPDYLIRSFRTALLLDGWLTVALAAFGLVAALLVTQHAGDRFFGQSLEAVRLQFYLLAAVNGIWLIMAALMLRKYRWAIWTCVWLSGIIAFACSFVVLTNFNSRGGGLYPVLCLLKVAPTIWLTQATWRMSRAGIPLGIQPA